MNLAAAAEVPLGRIGLGPERQATARQSGCRGPALGRTYEGAGVAGRRWCPAAVAGVTIALGRTVSGTGAGDRVAGRSQWPGARPDM